MIVTSAPLTQPPAINYYQTVGGLLEEIQRHMLEPVVDLGQTWQIWSANEVLNYLRERTSRFLLESGLVQDRSNFTTTSGVAQYDLLSTLAELKRVAVNGVGLFSMDYWQADNGVPGWETLSQTPYAYFENPIRQLSIDLVPTPGSGGQTVTYHMVRSTPFDVPSTNAPSDPGGIALSNYTLRLPAIFSWVVKYGVMADMLWKEGEAQDLQRAEWCEQRWRDGIEIARALVGFPSGGA